MLAVNLVKQKYQMSGVLRVFPFCNVFATEYVNQNFTVNSNNALITDWTLEYQGYMMSSHYTHYKSEFVCIDQNAEGIPRTNHNNNEPILYIADAKCSAGGGGLPCPPYVDGYDILCAVCSLWMLKVLTVEYLQ